MDHTEADIALVEKYFDAELSDAEMKEFDGRIQRDENFKMLVEHERALIAAIRFEGAATDLKFLKDLESKLQQQTPLSISRSAGKWYYYAAAAIAGIAVMVFAYVSTFKENNDELFQAYFTPYPNMFEPTVRSSESVESKRTEAFKAYEGGDYQKAASLFSDLLEENKEPGMLLLLGNSNLMLGRLDEAKANFLTLNKDYDELDIQAKWFLSLCYLKGGETEKATAILKELGNTEISYATKARELLEKVN